MIFVGSLSQAETSLGCKKKASLTVFLKIASQSVWAKNQDRVDEIIKIVKDNYSNVGIDIQIKEQVFNEPNVALSDSFVNIFGHSPHSSRIPKVYSSFFLEFDPEKYDTSVLNVFLIDQLGHNHKGVSSFSSAVTGMSFGLPGLSHCDAKFIRGCRSGVIMGANEKFESTTNLTMGNMLSHKMGHYLGLHHTTGASYQVGRMQAGFRGIYYQKNLMDSSVDDAERLKNDSISFTCKQAKIMKKHLLVQKVK